MIQAALAALNQGFHVFPLTEGDKTPHWLAGRSWAEAATNDVGQVISFWSRAPHANVAIACKPSELLVVDCDIAKADGNLVGTPWEYLHDAYGPRVNGEDLLDEIRFSKDGDGCGNMPATYTVRTASGGLHIYYRWPRSWPVASQASLVKGIIDIRGNGGQYGGYVVGAGSATPNGPYTALGTKDIPIPPQWIRTLVSERPQQPKPARPAGLMQPGAISWAGLEASVANAQPGNRNNALLWAARSMCSDGAPLSEAEDVLGNAARRAGLNEWEVDRTVRSAYRLQEHKDG